MHLLRLYALFIERKTTECIAEEGSLEAPEQKKHNTSIELNVRMTTNDVNSTRDAHVV